MKTKKYYPLLENINIAYLLLASVSCFFLLSSVLNDFELGAEYVYASIITILLTPIILATNMIAIVSADKLKVPTLVKVSISVSSIVLAAWTTNFIYNYIVL
ncbi:hypothetical protein EON76_04030 [bacterium]|nr:MAG: hypothetical protein EON76_04030 [bacterium]